MDNIVIIVFLCVALVAWISWLVYNYYILIIKVKQATAIDYLKTEITSYKNKYKNAQLCIDDLIKSIKANFPQSTIKYTIDKEGNQLIEGKIAY